MQNSSEESLIRSSVAGISIRGLSSVLPAERCSNVDDVDETKRKAAQRIAQATGIYERRLLNDDQSILDLSRLGCQHLLKCLGWSASEVGLLLNVTQTPDYPFPGNAVQLQHQLKLGRNTAAFDVNLGCSGFVYGLWQCGVLLNSLQTQKALLVVGDSTSRQCQPQSHKVTPFFGDAVSVVAIEKDPNAATMHFALGSDGSGTPYLLQPNGGALRPTEARDLSMDGTQVMAFSLRRVPEVVSSCLAQQQWQLSDVHHVVFHQANQMMLSHLAQKLCIPEEKMIYALKRVGNTSSASIPLALCLECAPTLTQQQCNLLLCGFGVGWSWGAVCLSLPALSVCDWVDTRDLS